MDELMSIRGTASILIALGLFAGNAAALSIDVDYTYAGTFFTIHPDAKTALDKAVFDINSVITSGLDSVPTDTYVGAEAIIDPDLPTTVTLNWGLNFANPSTGLTVTKDTFSSAANTFKLYVGARVLVGKLGEGGPAGTDVNIGVAGADPSSPEGKAEYLSAFAKAVAASNDGLVRGNSPTNSISGDYMVGSGADSATAHYSLQVSPLAGVLSLNSSTNWHFDINTLPAAGESDFYSVALHEILHTLGFGTMDTWENKVSGTNWSGSNVIALNGTGTNVISADGGHVAEGLMSTSIVTGLPQEAALDPTLTTGTRKTLTQLDLAFLRDIGYTTSAVPEPGTIALLGLAALGFLAVRRRLS